MSIIIGRVISDSILHCINGKTWGNLTNPSLTIRLCRKARIKVNPIRDPNVPKEIVNVRSITNYTMWMEGQHEPSCMGFIDLDLSVPPLHDLYGQRRFTKDYKNDFTAKQVV